MNHTEYYQKGLLYITYLLILSDNEISDTELSYLHKIRIEEGIDDHSFAEHFQSLIGKPEREIYQNGIESLNRCPDEMKLKAFTRLYQVALSDKILREKEIRFLIYSIKLSKMDVDTVIKKISRYEMASA